MSPQDQHIKAALKLLQRGAQRHDRYTLFSDCMEMIAISMSNSVDLRAREHREARYLEIVKRYDRETIVMFARFLAEVTMAFEAQPDDVLGRIFTELEIHNSNRGQFFTPYPVCRMMALATLGDAAAARALIGEKGFVTAMEPACGSGAMIIALVEAMREAGINYQRHLHVTAVDVDSRAVHMAYIQCSLLHIPAQLVVGNSLSMEMREHWFTPTHILGGWSARLAAHRRIEHAEPALEEPSAINQHSTSTVAERPLPPHGTQLSLF